MNLWTARKLALKCLETDLKQESELLDQVFQVLEYTTQKLAAIRPPSQFARVTALAAAKARNLLHCQYSLILDAHGQEAGAIGRVLLETLELLVYLNADPRRVKEALENRLPSAGQRAKEIGGNLQGLREHWNLHASHFRVSYESASHMVNFAELKIATRQPFKKHVLRENMGSLCAMLLWASIQTLHSFEIAGSKQNVVLRSRLVELRHRGGELFAFGVGAV